MLIVNASQWASAVSSWGLVVFVLSVATVSLSSSSKAMPDAYIRDVCSSDYGAVRQRTTHDPAL